MINQLVRGTFKEKKLGHILYRVMEAKDYDQVAEITTKAFLLKEPVIRGSQITQSELLDFFSLFKQHFINSETSIVAVDTTKNVIAGSRLCDDYNSDISEDQLNKISQKMNKILMWLENIKHQLIVDKLITGEKRKIYHLFFGAISPEYSNQGIIKQISLFNQELAWKLGFDYTLSEASSPITQHIYSTQGYSTIYFESYDNFQKGMGDQTINQTIMGEHFRDQSPGIKIMLKKLNASDFIEK